MFFFNRFLHVFDANIAKLNRLQLAIEYESKYICKHLIVASPSPHRYPDLDVYCYQKTVYKQEAF